LRLRVAFVRGFAHILDVIPCATAFLHYQGKHRTGRGKFKQGFEGGGRVESSKFQRNSKRQTTIRAWVVVVWIGTECGGVRE
jgi:hypothetical protein